MFDNHCPSGIRRVKLVNMLIIICFTMPYGQIDIFTDRLYGISLYPTSNTWKSITVLCVKIGKIRVFDIVLRLFTMGITNLVHYELFMN